MHVIFISACQKRAIPRSRAILDSYALRAGERCWMSPMTTEGLQEVRAALARNAHGRLPWPATRTMVAAV
ncbi:hypothetical protein [Bilophila wadsworthia]|uniref:hypothetical protein n=1 Tax=Bilophila wadsworthia TaxID=35833 RepID=UPI00242CA66D|nr:hypothetical protein [Bilophila wadsworthia]